MELDAERSRRLTRYECSIKQWIIPRFIHAYIDQPLTISASGNHPLLDSVVAPVCWLICECSDTVEQRMIPGGSNNERLTNVGTCTLSVTYAKYR